MYFRNYIILYLKICVSVYLPLFYFLVLYHCLVWSCSTQRNIDWIIRLQKLCIQIITYSQFTEYTGPFFCELKSLKVKDISSLTKLLFMFDFYQWKCSWRTKNNFLSSIHSYETYSSMVFCVLKAESWCFKFKYITLRWC